MPHAQTDIANRFPEVYASAAPTVLSDVHSTLKKNLENFFEKRESPRSLIVVGPGESVLPYSRQYKNAELGKTNRNFLSKLVSQQGTFLLVDYVSGDGKGLEKARATLKENGFFDDKYFADTRGVVSNSTDTSSLLALYLSRPRARRIRYVKANLCDKISWPEETADFIDMTLALHHATKTSARLNKICRGSYNFLKPGGVLHIGEGNVDMTSYVEEKLTKIGQALSSIFAQPILVEDIRGTVSSTLDKHACLPAPIYSLFVPGEKYSCLPEAETNITPEDKTNAVLVSETGVDIPHSLLKNKNIAPEQFSRYLNNAGYNVHFLPKRLCFPLIDRSSKEDRARYLIPVDKFYNSIVERASPLEFTNPVLLEQLVVALDEERESAKCGLSEYYVGEDKIFKALRSTGFEKISVIHHAKEPFYNLFAYKPER